MSADTVKDWVFNVIVSDPAITAIVGNRILASGAIGASPSSPAEPELPRRPFLVYRAGLVTSLMAGKTASYPFDFWVHDDMGSYTVHINPCLDAIRKAFRNRGPQHWNDRQMYQAQWQGYSEDLYDPDFRTAVRYCSILVIADAE